MAVTQREADVAKAQLIQQIKALHEHDLSRELEVGTRLLSCRGEARQPLCVTTWPLRVFANEQALQVKYSMAGENLAAQERSARRRSESACRTPHCAICSLHMTLCPCVCAHPQRSGTRQKQLCARPSSPCSGSAMHSKRSSRPLKPRPIASSPAARMQRPLPLLWLPVAYKPRRLRRLLGHARPSPERLSRHRTHATARLALPTQGQTPLVKASTPASSRSQRRQTSTRPCCPPWLWATSAAWSARAPRAVQASSRSTRRWTPWLLSLTSTPARCSRVRTSCLAPTAAACASKLTQPGAPAVWACRSCSCLFPYCRCCCFPHTTNWLLCCCLRDCVVRLKSHTTPSCSPRGVHTINLLPTPPLTNYSLACACGTTQGRYTSHASAETTHGHARTA